MSAQLFSKSKIWKCKVILFFSGKSLEKKVILFFFWKIARKKSELLFSPKISPKKGERSFSLENGAQNFRLRRIFAPCALYRPQKHSKIFRLRRKTNHSYVIFPNHPDFVQKKVSFIFLPFSSEKKVSFFFRWAASFLRFLNFENRRWALFFSENLPKSRGCAN